MVLPSRRLTAPLLRYRQPVLADEVQTFKALITIHKVLQEGHPAVVREAQAHANWVDSLMRGVAGDGIRGMRLLVALGRFASFRQKAD